MFRCSRACAVFGSASSAIPVYSNMFPTHRAFNRSRPREPAADACNMKGVGAQQACGRCAGHVLQADRADSVDVHSSRQLQGEHAGAVLVTAQAVRARDCGRVVGTRAASAAQAVELALQRVARAAGHRAAQEEQDGGGERRGERDEDREQRAGRAALRGHDVDRREHGCATGGTQRAAPARRAGHSGGRRARLWLSLGAYASRAGRVRYTGRRSQHCGRELGGGFRRLAGLPSGPTRESGAGRCKAEFGFARETAGRLSIGGRGAAHEVYGFEQRAPGRVLRRIRGYA